MSIHDKLRSLNCGGNKISVLDLTNKPKLWEVACARNQIRELDVTGCPKLHSLYCYNNPIRTLDVTNNPDLRTLSCTNTLISELDISQNPLLRQLDCGGNYLAALDVSHNPELRELYYSGTTLRNVDVSKNIHLVSLDCISTDIMTLDISANSSLDALGCYGNSRLEALYITSSDNPAYPYATDLREYTGDSFARVTALSAYTRTGSPIPASFVPGQHTALFAQLPHYIVYDYSTGYTGNAASDSVPRTMHVKISVPSLNFTYLPKIESKVVSVDSKVVSVDEAVAFHAVSITPNTPAEPSTPDSPEPEPETPDTPDEPETPDSSAQTFTGSSSGGCDSGLGIFALGLVILVLLSRKRTGLFAVILLLAFASSSRAANIKAADYTLPIPYETYTISGTYSTNFTLTPELVNTVAKIANISADRVHSFADIALPETWNVLPIDLYNLSRSGEYGGIVLPLTSTGTQNDRYILHCTFSNDIQPGEQISLHGFEVDTQTRESVYDENKSYLAAFIVLDENLTRIEYVPDNRRVYIALSLRPEYVNTGIVTVVRGRYVEEEDPVYRLGSDAGQRIADDLGIHLEDLKYLTRANIGRPVEPTDAMKVYVNSDDHEIIINMPTISVDEEGRYIIPITLSDDEFELVRSRDVREFKTYALNDSDLGNGQMRPAFIFGLINTWELYTLNGEKLETFGVKEFLLVGLLQAGKPFSLYLAKLIIMLLLGGCNFGAGIFAGGAVILVIMLVKNRTAK
ncbi:MAG: hypothetical protein IJS39_04915 [Synergistaceae bacterium]|nr:hypothetical protein [Synergistaceae bacterium]